MHAIIMGAGEGTRMWPISTMVNKHLLKLGGKPVIRIIVERIIVSFAKLSMLGNNSNIVIVCLKKDEKDYKWEFRDFPGITFHVIEENKGTADEFYDAIKKITKPDYSVFLHYGDTITDLDYGKMITDWNNAKTAHAMIAITKNLKHDYSEVHTGAQGMVYKIVEKPDLTVPSWTGIGIFNAGYFDKIYHNILASQYPDKGDIDFGYHLLPAMAKTGKLWGWEYNGKYFDVGNLRSYLKLYQEYQNKDLNL